MYKFVRKLNTKKLEINLKLCSCNSSQNTSVKEEEKKLTLKKEPQNSVLKVPQKVPTDVTKEDLKWRSPWTEKDKDAYIKLRIFNPEESNTSLLKWIQQPLDLRPSTIKKWIQRKQAEVDAVVQRYIPERHNILGPELACAHFVVYRGGAVKFHGDDKWIKAEDGKYDLPPKYQAGMFLQGIDCSEFSIRYEGLANLRDLRNVEWLSLNGCKHIDDYCIDVISNIFSHSLIYLDLRNCLKISERGLGALYRMKNLKILYLDDMLRDTRYELTCLLLEELNPELTIKSDVINFEIK